MTNFNEWTNTLLYKNISLTALYSRKGWCFLLCVRGELETGTDGYILTPSSSDHSSTSFESWLGCSTVGHWEPQASRLFLTLASCPQQTPTATGTQLTQAVCCTWLYNCLTSTCFLWAYASATITEFNHVHGSRWYSDIFDLMHLFCCSSTYLHRCISRLTARSRVNMLQFNLFLK